MKDGITAPRRLIDINALPLDHAVANAVWHATGMRMCELPITPEMLLG